MSENEAATEKTLTEKTLTGVGWLFGEKVLRQVMALAISIILARILIPEEYGIVALCSVFITICNVFIATGLSAALVQKKDVDDLDFSSVMIASLFIAAVLYAVLFFLAPLIADFFSVYDKFTVVSVVRLMSLSMPLGAIKSVQAAFVQRKMIFKKFFWSNFLGTLLSGAAGIIMAIYGYGVYALVAQHLINAVVDMLVLTMVLRWFPKLKISLKRLKGLFSYGSKILFSTLIDTLYNELRSLVIGKKYTASDLAYYNKGRNYPSLLCENVNLSINDALFPALSKIQDDGEKIRYAIKRSIKLCSFVIFPLLAGLALVAPSLVSLLLTDKWQPIVPYMRMMCFVFAVLPVETANLQAIKAVGKSGLFLKLEIIKKSVGIALIAASMWFGVFWIAVSAMVTMLISDFISVYPNKKLFGYGFTAQLKDLVPFFLLALGMSVPVYLAGLLPLADYLKLILQTVIGGITYIGLSVLFKIDEFYYVLGIIKKVTRRSPKKAENEIAGDIKEEK